MAATPGPASVTSAASGTGGSIPSAVAVFIRFSFLDLPAGAILAWKRPLLPAPFRSAVRRVAAELQRRDAEALAREIAKHGEAKRPSSEQL